jgi:hypothetical protein
MRHGGKEGAAGQTPVRADAFARWLAGERRSIPPAAAGLLGLTLLVTSAGFYRLVYFISLGYAFSVVALAKATALRFWPNRTPAAALQGRCWPPGGCAWAATCCAASSSPPTGSSWRRSTPATPPSPSPAAP